MTAKIVVAIEAVVVAVVVGAETSQIEDSFLLISDNSSCVESDTMISGVQEVVWNEKGKKKSELHMSNI